MFGLFKSPPYSDPELGELRWSKGHWRGAVALGGEQVPLALAGSRKAPDPQALELARGIPSGFPLWRPALGQAMFEHYAPYAEAVRAGAAPPTGSSFPQVDRPDGVWPHATAEYVLVSPLEGRLMVEIGYRVAWDEEHTLGARLADGRLVELCGSVLAP